jgi:uncharacterized protein involved in exopolysaccharide biosynthesis
MAYATKAARDKAVESQQKNVETLKAQQTKTGERYKALVRQVRLAEAELEHRKTAPTLEDDDPADVAE